MTTQPSEDNRLMIVIEKLRKAQGLNIRHLCGKVGIDNTYYSKLLAGDRSPSLSLLLKMADLLDCEVKLCFKDKKNDQFV